MPRRRNLFTLLTLLVILGGLLLQACGPEPTKAPPTPEPNAKEGKVDTILLGVLLKYATTEGNKDQKLQAAVDYAQQQGVIDDSSEVYFELELDDPSAEKPITDKINTMGGKVTNSAKEGNVVKMRVKVPVQVFVDYVNTGTQDNFLTDLAGFKGVAGINFIYKRQTTDLYGLPQTLDALFQVGRIAKNEGIKVMQTDKWQAAGFTGKGVRIGVIDGGFKFYEELRGTYLPKDFQPVDMDKEVGGSGVVDEDVHGTAVSEIIYSHAPDATYFPVAIDGSDDQFSRAIDYLVSQNVNIISASMGGHGTSGDGNSFLDKKIERLRTEKGILFLFSAGNEGVSHYAGYFDPAPDGFHQWIPGVTRMAIGNPSGNSYSTYVILNWEQWKDGGTNPAATDLDLYITDQNGNVLKSATNTQSARPPRENIPLSLAPGQLVYIKVRAKTQTKTDRFRLHIFSHDIPLQFAVPRMAIGDPATSKGALAVGATYFQNDTIEYYSSQGPLPNGVFKPEISGPARVSSAAYENEGSANFPGTSASCPQIAGMAAVLKGANPGLNIEDFTTTVLEKTKDLGAPGPDYTFGYGRADIGSQPGQNNAKPQGKLAPKPTANPNPELQPTLIVTLKSGFAYPTPAVTPGLSRTTTAAVNTTQPVTQAVIPDTVAPLGQVTFSDNFGFTNSGLPNNNQTLYRSSKYVVKANPNQLAWGVYPATKIQTNLFNAEVKLEGVSGTSGLYGLVFWYQNPNEYYLASVTGSGQAQVSRFSNGAWQEIISWTAASNWKNGAANKLGIQVSSNGLRLIVNDRAINAQPVRASSNGSIGFAAGSYGSAVEASFSEFRLGSR
jgi:hypothetical protein